MFLPVLKVTKRVDTDEKDWKGWNWRSEGDEMVNGAYFVASGEGLDLKYEKAYSVEPKSASYIDQLVMNAGVLGDRFVFLPFYFHSIITHHFSFVSFHGIPLYMNSIHTNRIPSYVSNSPCILLTTFALWPTTF